MKLSFFIPIFLLGKFQIEMVSNEKERIFFSLKVKVLERAQRERERPKEEKEKLHEVR